MPALDPCLTCVRSGHGKFTVPAGVLQGEHLFHCCSVDNTTAADGADPNATSEFNRSFINANAEKRSLHDVHQKILNGNQTSVIMEVLKFYCQLYCFSSPSDFLSTSVDQRPVFRTGMSDGSITLHDPIMIDDPELEDKLDHVLRDYHHAHGKGAC